MGCVVCNSKYTYAYRGKDYCKRHLEKIDKAYADSFESPFECSAVKPISDMEQLALARVLPDHEGNGVVFSRCIACDSILPESQVAKGVVKCSECRKEEYFSLRQSKQVRR